MTPSFLDPMTRPSSVGIDPCTPDGVGPGAGGWSRPAPRNIKSPHRRGGGSWCRAIARARSGERPSLGKELDHVDRLGRRFPGGVHMRCRPAVGTWRMTDGGHQIAATRTSSGPSMRTDHWSAPTPSRQLEASPHSDLGVTKSPPSSASLLTSLCRSSRHLPCPDSGTGREACRRRPRAQMVW